MSKLSAMIRESMTDFTKDIEEGLLRQFENYEEKDLISAEDARDKIRDFFESLRVRLAK